MDLVNRYVYAVTKSFPKKQREEIEMELRANIEDMIEQNQELESYEEKVKKVLLELGNPEVLADDYRGSKRYLIGPQYYEMYLLVLKIVFGAVFGGISIAIFIESIFIANKNVSTIASDYLSALFSGIMQAFAWITIGFMLAERKNVKLNNMHTKKDKWDLSQLPVVPDKKAVIPLSECIFSIIFTTIFYTIFIALLFSAPKLFAAYIHSGSETIIIPVFNVEVLQSYRVILVSVFILSILKELFKLYYRRWTLKLSIIHVILTVITTVLILIVVTDNSVWNSNFSTEIIKHMNINFDFQSLWERIKSWFAAVIVLSCLIESIVVLYKGIRYNTKAY